MEHRGALPSFGLPFSGLNVLDFCWVVIGPMTTRYFSDYGATVVRVESAHRPDVLRNGEPFAGGEPGIDRSGYYANYNSGKLSIALNMADDRAKEIAFELATQWADVVTENFTPGTIERMGLGYDAIAAVNPRVILFSASMLGRGGPNDAQPGFGPVLTALSGHTHLTGWPDRAPTSPYGAYTDFLIPHLAISAIAGALEHRRETGKGQHLDLSQLEASLYFVAQPLLDFSANDRLNARDGNRDPAMAPHNAYPCSLAGTWCTIACPDDDAWRRLSALIGQPGLADDPRFASVQDRKRNDDGIDAIVGAWTVSMEAGEVMRRCQEAGVPAGAVRSSADLFDDQQLAHRQHFVYMDHAEMGRYASDGNSFKLSAAEPTYRPSPLLGEHSEYVCLDLLGMDATRFRQMQNDGVLE